MGIKRSWHLQKFYSIVILLLLFQRPIKNNGFGTHWGG